MIHPPDIWPPRVPQAPQPFNTLPKGASREEWETLDKEWDRYHIEYLEYEAERCEGLVCFLSEKIKAMQVERAALSARGKSHRKSAQKARGRVL